jgi:Photosynthetic reaction centre cytochrome C subunit
MHRRFINSFAVIFALTLAFGLLGIWIYSTKTAARVASREGAETQQSEVFDQNQKLAELNKRIAGQETKPAGEVFKNVQILKGMPAGRFLKVMELGYSKSLGVNCSHCHVVDQWEKDDKPTKQITREMAKMAGVINNDLLKNIKNLKSENPVINCTTCHRGQIKPAINLP